MLPPVIHERLVQRFNYWNQTVQQGMMYQHQLYAFCGLYRKEQRADAYSFINELAERGLDMCLTVSNEHYTVWINLRSVSLLNSSHSVSSTNETVLQFRGCACA